MSATTALLEMVDIGASASGIEGLSLSIAHGEIVGLIGNRGAGKRAVLDLVVGEALPDQGKIRFRQHDISRMPARQRARHGLRSPLQQASLSERMRDAFWPPTVGRLIVRGLRLAGHRATGRQLAARIDAVLDQVGMHSVQQLTMRELSAGMVLRVQLAELLASEPVLIVIDEPFKAWDAVTGQIAQRLLLDLRDELGLSMLISDRSWGVLRFCDRAYVIDERRIVDQGPPTHVAQWFDIGERRGPHSPNLRAVFISYRRDDSLAQVDALHEHLAQHFGSHAIWRDLTSIRPGSRFADEIEFAIRRCDVLLAVIGTAWQGEGRGSDNSRLQGVDDPVRREIEVALQHGVPIVPVLVDGAGMPDRDRLPPSMRELLALQALQLPGRVFDPAAIETLIEAIEVARARRQAGADGMHRPIC